MASKSKKVLMMLSSQSMVALRGGVVGGAGRGGGRRAARRRGSGSTGPGLPLGRVAVCSALGRYCSGIGEPGNHFW